MSLELQAKTAEKILVDVCTYLMQRAENISRIALVGDGPIEREALAFGELVLMQACTDLIGATLVRHE